MKAKLITAGLFFVVAGVAAQEPDMSYTFPIGQACPDFSLKIDIFNNDHRVIREFKDQYGKPIRLLETGRGNTLVFTNIEADKQLPLHSNGSVAKIVYNADGSQTYTVTGHNVLILFPGDVPTGPSTILYVGRLVFLQRDTATELLSNPVGTTTDICAALR